jgi:hypothetical protein
MPLIPFANRFRETQHDRSYERVVGKERREARPVDHVGILLAVREQRLHVSETDILTAFPIAGAGSKTY